MRRAEFKSENPEQFDFIVKTAEVGHLGIITPDGFPRVVPVNFVAEGTTIYFHGATDGEKYQIISASPKVTFSVEVPYSVIPSYWLSRENAGGATHYYKSILIRGAGLVVTDKVEKAHALQILMEKYQPEGGYLPVTPDEPLYTDTMAHTAVFRIDPIQIDVKIKLPFHKPEEFKRSLIEKLTARAKGPDLATAEELRKSLKKD